ncbi:MAG: response regulator [Candidatus Paceibacterota bacterium]
MAGNQIILIAEDEKPMASALEMKLTGEGFDVEVAEDGADAIKKVEGTTYTLVLLDIVMPGADGFDVLEKINPKKSGTHVLVLSNLSQEEDREKATNLGASDYMVKSDTSINDIVAYVKKTLNTE